MNITIKDCDEVIAGALAEYELPATPAMIRRVRTMIQKAYDQQLYYEACYMASEIADKAEQAAANKQEDEA